MYIKNLFLLFIILIVNTSSFAMHNSRISLGELAVFDSFHLSLCKAILEDDGETIKMLINSDKEYCEEEISALKTPIPYFGGSLLGVASQIGNKSIVNLLKNSGAYLLLDDFMDETIPLHIAVYFGYLEIVKDLFKKFPNLKIAERFLKGSTALYLAFYTGNYDIADFIIKAGVEIDSVSSLFLEMNPDIKLHLGLNK